MFTKQETINIKKNIKDSIDKKNQIFYILTGPNGSGKTTLLNEIKNELTKDKNSFVFYLGGEIIIENELKENKSKEEFKAQLRDFLNINFRTEVNISENNNFKEAINNISNVLKKIKETKSNKYFKEKFLNIFEIDKNIMLGNVVLEIVNSSDKFKDFSSGEGMFSLLYLLKSILEVSKKSVEKNISILIDEPEKFLHDSLIKKVCNLFFELFSSYQNVSFVISTHSSYLLNEITNLFRKKELHFNNLKLINKNEYLDLSEILFNRNINTRELAILTKLIFDEYILLVEGLNDYEFVNLLCINNFNDYFFNIYDCGGKNNVKKICEEALKINNFVFCFFDKDYNKNNDKNAKEKSDKYKKYFELNNLYYYEFDDNLEDFFNNKIDKKQFAEKINIKLIEENDKVKNIFSKLEIFFKQGEQND